MMEALFFMPYKELLEEIEDLYVKNNRDVMTVNTYFH